MWSDANNRDVEPQLDIDDIQGDVLVGLQKDFEWFIFFKIGEDVDKFKEFARKSLIPKITSAADALQWQIALEARASAGQTYTLPMVGVNLGFTKEGLDALRVPGKISDSAFNAGMASRSREIGDPDDEKFAPATWIIGGPNNTPDGVILLTGATQAAVDRVKEELAPHIPAKENRTEQQQTDEEIANGWKVLYAECANTRPNNRGREHFGFVDGISQPGIRGRIDQEFPDRKFLQPDQTLNNSGRPSQGSDLVWPGAVVFGYPSSADPDSTQPDGPGERASGGVAWARNGSLMVLRRFQQDVLGFNNFIEQQAQNRSDPERIAAEVLGRWKSGAPLALAPFQDDGSLGADPLRNNAFDFANDRQGRRCPVTAHIRQMYPRSDARSNYSHRLIRRGIPFGPEISPDETAGTKPGVERGLMFVCYQTSIERQFEELTKRMNEATGQFLRFIHLAGGGYFFVPSITTCKNLVAPERPRVPRGEESVPPLKFDQSNLEHVFLRLRDLMNAGDYDDMRPLLDSNVVWTRIHHAASLAGGDGLIEWLKDDKNAMKPQFIPDLNRTNTVLTGDGSVLISGEADWKANRAMQNTERIDYHLNFSKQADRWFLSNGFAIPHSSDQNIEKNVNSQILDALKTLIELFNAGRYREMKPLMDPNITWKQIHHADSLMGADQLISWLQDYKALLKPQFGDHNTQIAPNLDGSYRISGRAKWQAHASSVEEIEYHFTFVKPGDSWLLSLGFAVPIRVVAAA